MNKITFRQLNGKQQLWYSTVMLNMVLADGEIHPAEQKYLALIFDSFSNSPELLAQLRQQSEMKAPIPLTAPQGISKKMAKTILQDCVSVAIADGIFHDNERTMVLEVGEMLKLSPAEIEEMIVWGQGVLGHIFSFES